MYFIHISDTHIGPDAHYELHGVNTAESLSCVVQKISEWHSDGVPIDCVVHTGDVTTDGDSGHHGGLSLKFARSLFESLPVPLHCLNGNHDDAAALRATFPDARVRRAGLAGDRPLAGVIDYPDCRLLFLDARPLDGDPPDPQGRLDDDQLELCQHALSDAARVAIMLHYPPMPLDCEWLSRSMLIDNGPALHHLLAESASRVAGVFFGHLHHNVQLHLDGVLYSGAGGSACHFPAWPAQRLVTQEPQRAITLQYIRTGNHPTLIKHLTVPLGPNSPDPDHRHP